MKITDVKLITQELPEGGGPGRIPQLVQVPGLHRIQYRAGVDAEREPIVTPPSKPRERFVEVRTDQGITGRVTASTMDEYQVDLVRSMAIGENPLHRERLYQMFQKGTRWSTRNRVGSATSTTASGTSPAKRPVCPCTP